MGDSTNKFQCISMIIMNYILKLFNYSSNYNELKFGNLFWNSLQIIPFHL